MKIQDFDQLRTRLQTLNDLREESLAGTPPEDLETLAGQLDEAAKMVRAALGSKYQAAVEARIAENHRKSRAPNPLRPAALK